LSHGSAQSREGREDAGWGEREGVREATQISNHINAPSVFLHRKKTYTLHPTPYTPCTLDHNDTLTESYITNSLDRH